MDRSQDRNAYKHDQMNSLIYELSGKLVMPALGGT